MLLLEHWIDKRIWHGGEREMLGGGWERGKEIRKEGGKNEEKEREEEMKAGRGNEKQKK